MAIITVDPVFEFQDGTVFTYQDGANFSFTGGASLTPITASGAVTVVGTAHGSVIVTEVSASGVITFINHRAFGASSLTKITASGTATLTLKTIGQIPSPLLSPKILTFNNFASLPELPPVNYVMQLEGSSTVAIPISSWQATIQNDRQSYVYCVIPAAEDYLTALSAALNVDEFVIYRKAMFGGTIITAEMVRSNVETIQVYHGPYRYTATIAGYTDTFSDTPITTTTTLTDIRLFNQTIDGNIQVRCGIDWFLRPGKNATAEDVTFEVTYITYYITTDGDEYMDVGTRL